MAELKTKPTDESVNAFLASIPDENRRQDCYTIVELMKKVTGEEPKMWGEAIVGFGDQHYKYASGREGDWFVTGFSPRKQNLTLYLSSYSLDTRQDDLLTRLGKHKTGKGCLYIKRLSDLDLAVLEELIAETVNKSAA